MRRFIILVVCLSPCFLLTPRPAGAETADGLIKEAQASLQSGKIEAALGLAAKAIRLDPKNARAWLCQATCRAALGKHKEAIADCGRVLELDPQLGPDALSIRGGEYFKLGKIRASLADFDRQIKLKPADRAGHWRRGIDLYYVGKFEDGRKQFEGYEEVDTNDVENAVWHFLCVARSKGLAAARKAMLKIGKDPRVPMMEVYALYLGKAKPDDVLAAAKKVAKGARADLRKQQMFYAHLYLGLYYEATGDKKQALAHMTLAAKDFAIGQYIGDVARVHLAMLRKNAGEKR
jgi:lipoprotein NlpI